MTALTHRLILGGCRTTLNYARLQQYQQCRLILTGKEMRKAIHKTRSRITLINVTSGGVFVGAAALFAWGYKSLQEKPIGVAVGNALDEQIECYRLKQEPPSFEPSRRITSTVDHTGLKLTLYQYQTCPFCCKVRTFLDYYGFAYDVIEVNSVTRTQTKWTDYRKVPFLLVEVPETKNIYQLKDSSVIISALHSILVNPEMTVEDIFSSYPRTSYLDDNGKAKTEIVNRYFLMFGDNKPDRATKEITNERVWRRWVDDVFVHTLSPNIYRSPTEAFQAFNWFSEVGEWEKHFATWERLLVIYVGSVAMYFIGKNLKKRHILKDDVRLSLYDESNLWLKKINEKGTSFMGGSRPDISDLNVYGILTAIEGCDSFRDLLENTKIEKWFNEMKVQVQEKNGSELIRNRGIV